MSGRGCLYVGVELRYLGEADSTNAAHRDRNTDGEGLPVVHLMLGFRV
jgi:hypothetical protein